ncbi:ABC transporter permease [Isachenkonia alkalipeptolytica]|uniref:Transport permease protein n=1 Tax=Isachenkonia alkalipeptolytica TaxID=2565777 RepID=A0AA44BD85_9CLOT|nr:ABC transporter permease [Isachenkonia alkalipeptolytica]NBG87672.1 ABC transporter permease [Isachenkonia alkalipeptolytica]
MNKRLIHATRTFMKETFRNKLDIFFTVFFPILFIVIFGNMFLMGSDQDQIWRVGLIAEEAGEIEPYFAPHRVTVYDDEESLSTAVEERREQVGVDYRPGAATIYLLEDLQSMGEGIFLQGFVETTLRQYALGTDQQFIALEDELVAVGAEAAFEIDYLITGVMALSLLSGGMFATIGVFGRYKKQEVIKRFMATPMKPWEFVTGASFTKILLNFAAIMIIIYLSRLLYGVSLDFHWGIFLAIILTSSIGMMGFGVLVLLVFRKTETALTGASILYVIMTFFSGVYFPVAFIPDQFQWVSRILPVTYLIEVLRYGAGIEAMDAGYFLMLNGVFVILGGGLLVLASKRFVDSEKQ